ncbi:MAG: hypothetical protein V5A48_09910 [Salinivenus sp.]
MDAVQHDLRERLARRQQEKAEMERQVHAVQHRYQEEVAPLKEKVLRLQMERLRRAAQRNMRSARHRNAYHDAQRAYETFRDERPPPADPGAPDDLKRRYRAASKRCHPDVVPEAYRAEAAATFQALESAYQAGHARAVRAIADALEQWGFPGTPAADEHAGDREARDLRRAVSALETAIASLRERDAYQALTDAEDVDDALRAQKEGLRQVLAELRRRRQRA